jgi:hypothetical protein
VAKLPTKQKVRAMLKQTRAVRKYGPFAVLILATIFSGCVPATLSSTSKYRPKNLLLKDESLINQAPPAKLSQIQVVEDLGLLRYAMGHAWAPAWLKPYETTQSLAKLESVGQQKAELSSESLCDLVADTIHLVPDNHSYATVSDRKCGSTINVGNRDIGPNLSKNNSDPYIVEWKHVGNRKILTFAAKSFPRFSRSVYKNLKENFQGLLLQANGLIIDLRGHSGGDNDPGFFIASLLWGRKAPDSRDRFQVQTSEALALFANRFDLDLKQSNTTLENLESAKERRDGLLRDLKTSLEGGLSLITYTSKDTYLDPVGTNLRVDKNGFKNPIFIIMDQDAGSGAEEMIGVLEKHPNVILVGQPTSGTTHFGNAGVLLLPNSKIQVWLSTAFSKFRDGKFIERIGFQPKIVVPDGTDAMLFIESNWEKLTAI